MVADDSVNERQRANQFFPQRTARRRFLQLVQPAAGRQSNCAGFDVKPHIDVLGSYLLAIYQELSKGSLAGAVWDPVERSGSRAAAAANLWIADSRTVATGISFTCSMISNWRVITGLTVRA